MGSSNPPLSPIFKDEHSNDRGNDDDNNDDDDNENTNYKNNDDDKLNTPIENLLDDLNSMLPSYKPTSSSSTTAATNERKRHLKQKKKKSSSSDSSGSSSDSSTKETIIDEDNTQESVIDSQLRVRGVKNLRVAGKLNSIFVYNNSYYYFHLKKLISNKIDASSIPVIPNGNVHSTVVMIASRAADILIEEYKQESGLQSYGWYD